MFPKIAIELKEKLNEAKLLLGIAKKKSYPNSINDYNYILELISNQIFLKDQIKLLDIIANLHIENDYTDNAISIYEQIKRILKSCKTIRKTIHKTIW